MSDNNPKPSPRVYAACLAAYNAGRLHGRWIDADQEPEAIMEEIQGMLAGSPEPQAEEWSFHDAEGFGHLCLSENEGVERISALAKFIVENTRFGTELLARFNGDLDEAGTALENYAGEFRSLPEFAQELTEETTDILSCLRNYIDYEAMARDMEINGEVFTVETGFEEVHVFWTS